MTDKGSGGRAVNQRLPKSLPPWLPFAVGGLLVVQFAGLGLWQVERGLEKRAKRAAFETETGFAAWSDGMEIRPYQRLKATGAYDAGRQFLLDNIILNNRYGHYVLSALIVADDEPALIVNRGWVERSELDRLDIETSLPAARVTVRGRAGSLPRAGYRMGAPIADGQDWPKHAVFPTLADLELALDRDLQPFVLLMDPEEQHGFLRHWVPEEMGPGRHFAYAFQWFAIAAVLAGLLVWHFHRRAFRHA